MIAKLKQVAERMRGAQQRVAAQASEVLTQKMAARAEQKKRAMHGRGVPVPQGVQFTVYRMRKRSYVSPRWLEVVAGIAKKVISDIAKGK